MNNVAEKMKKAGRPSIISNADRRSLKRIIKVNWRSNTREITVLWRDAIKKQISVTTTKRQIKKIGYRFYKAKQKPLLTKLQMRNRLKWARTYRFWTHVQS
ncbi:hypothetical protein ILUMI_10537 [Ignelater luminosus]|uniref:Transposase Tc1-like domain-containing protein n=1 Tax=Ignelater luminosus TaxID=2038154 RepID=A0A8K0D082_IGNLU|nr:hypothetical protein ILUMI_10537 [Ignelater luminosus]